MIDHCISAFIKSKKDEVFRNYIADCLKAIAYNTSHSDGMEILSTYRELIDFEKKSGNRTAEDIIYDISQKLEGLKE